jgi:hypothetical protein
MIVGIHQPNYLPGLSYFGKILHSELFVFLDSVQYSKGSWTNRNRIKSQQGEIMLTVPILTKTQGFQPISEIRILTNANWKKKHLKSFSQNYSKAPFFHQYFPVFKAIYSQDWESLAELNITLITKICGLLGIDKNFILSSNLDDKTQRSTDLLIYLTKAVGGDIYLSGVGGTKYMEVEKFKANNLSLLFARFSPVAYRQQFGNFITNLSIVDLLFNEGPNALNILKNSTRIET